MSEVMTQVQGLIDDELCTHNGGGFTPDTLWSATTDTRLGAAKRVIAVTAAEARRWKNCAMQQQDEIAALKDQLKVMEKQRDLLMDPIVRAKMLETHAVLISLAT